MQGKRLLALTTALAVAPLLALPRVATAANVVANPLCKSETAFFDPGSGQNINVPPGFTISVFAKGLNMPTGIAFRGNTNRFNVYVLESGHGLPSDCNEQGSWPGGVFDAANPFTPDIVVFDQNGKKIGGPLGKPTSNGGGFQPAGPAVDIAFEHGFQGGRLFATDSNQATHGGGQNSSSRIVVVDPNSGAVSPFIIGLPTGDHPTEQLAFKDDWIYWSQGSTTNSGVVGLDNNVARISPISPVRTSLSVKTYSPRASARSKQRAATSRSVFRQRGPLYRLSRTRRPASLARAFATARRCGRSSTIRRQSSQSGGGTATVTRSGSHPIIIRWPVSCWSAKTAPTSAVRDLRMAPPRCSRLTNRTRTAHPSTTAGRTATASWRRVRRCSTRSAVRATISASSMRAIHRASARPRALRIS